MQPSGKTLLPGWCVLLALLLIHPTAAEPSPPLEWLRDGGTLQVTWPQESQAQMAKVQVLNRSSSRQNVQVELISVDSSATEKVGSFLDVKPRKAPVDPGKALTLTISALLEAKPKPGTYEGVLVAYSEVPGSSIRRDVRLTVLPKEPAASERPLKFLVTEMKLRTYRCPCWGSCWCLCRCPCWGDPLDDTEIPANIGAAGNWNSHKTYLATADGATAELSLCQPQPLIEGFHRVNVKVDDIDRVGTYSGKLTAGTGNDAEAVSLTLTVAHHPVFAALAVVSGIILALWIQRYMGVLRLTWSLAQREAEVGTKLDHAQEIFSEKAAGQRFASYSLSDFEARREVLREKIIALQRSVFTSLGTANPKYLEVDAELRVLEAVPEQWEGFAPKLSNLAGALNNVAWGQTSTYLEPAPAPERPAIRKKLEQFLAGSELTVQKLGEQYAEISNGPDLLAVWQGLNRRAAALHARLVSLKEEIKASDDATKLRSQSSLEQAETALVSIWNRLWSYADLDPAAQTGLDAVENHLAFVRTLIPETRGPEEALEDKAPALPASADIGAILRRLTAAPTPIQRPVSDFERLRLLHQRQRLSAWAVALVGFLIALYTGMNQFYIGKPFGYWLDYVEIVAWAVAAQSVLEMLLRGLDRIWGLGGLFRGRTT